MQLMLKTGTCRAEPMSSWMAQGDTSHCIHAPGGTGNHPLLALVVTVCSLSRPTVSPKGQLVALHADSLTAVWRVQAFHASKTEEEGSVLAEQCSSNKSGFAWLSE